MLSSTDNTAPNLFVVCDLDRTLLNTSLVFDIFQSVLNDRGYGNSEKLHNARRQLEGSGGSFDAFVYIESLLSKQQFEEVMDAFRSKARERDLFNKGAYEFLGFLKQRQINFGILTYGSENWQQEKIEVAGLGDMPTIIIPRKGKGQLISTWYHKDTETFLVPTVFGGGVYKQLIMIDDKVSELGGLPPYATGLLYRPNDDILPSQAGDIQGENVYQMRSFKEVADYILASV